MQQELPLRGKKFVFIGGGSESVPGILEARLMGADVMVLDANAQCDGARMADHFVKCPIEMPAETDAIVSREFGGFIPDVVTSVGTDFPETVALLTARFETIGVPVDSAVISSSKIRQKSFLQGIKVPTAFGAVVQSLHDGFQRFEEFGRRAIVKPVDSRGSRGVFLPSNRGQFEACFEAAQLVSPSGTVIVEEFMKGPQLSSESLVVDGICHTLGLSLRNYRTTRQFLPAVLEDGGDLTPTTFEDYHYAVDELLQPVVTALGVNQGSIKGDLVITKSGLKIVEFALRPSGGYFCSHQIPAATSVNFLAELFLNLAGRPESVPQLKVASHKHVSQRFILPTSGVQPASLKTPTWAEPNSSVIAFDLATRPKTVAGPLNHSSRRGSVITRPDGEVTSVCLAERFILEASS